MVRRSVGLCGCFLIQSHRKSRTSLQLVISIISQEWHKEEISYTNFTMTIGISTGGKVFFGSLCASTFGLGCWQLQRLYEKIEKIEDRQEQLQMSPTADWKSQEHPYRRRLIKGSFRHEKELLIGPRGAPSGVSLPRKGLSAKQAGSGQSSGMAPGPQGYFVLAPMVLEDKSTVWINRGWIPKTMVPDGKRGAPTSSTWTRPTGTTSLTAIRSSPESESFFSLERSFSHAVFSFTFFLLLYIFRTKNHYTGARLCQTAATAVLV